MKKYFLLLIAMLTMSIANAQISITTYLITDSTALFTRSLPANTVLLSAQTNLLFRLNQAASTSFSLTTANKSLLTADFTETDPVWLSERSLYATQQWVTENATVTETDPIWNAAKASYATQTWTNSQGFLKSFTETDPIWNAAKNNYATKTNVHDTANVLRSEFEKFVIIDNSGLWVSSGKEVILSSTNSIVTVKNNKTYNFVKTSNNANYTYIDSIEITNLADVEIVATAKGTNTIGTFKHTTAYNSALGVLNLVGINTSEIKCASYPSTHFTYDTRANWLRFKVKSSELVTWRFKVELNYN